MRKQIYYSFKTLVHDRVTTLIKMVSIGVGLAMCLLLFTRISYERSYDTGFAEHERIYQLWMEWKFSDYWCSPGECCIGKIGGGLYEELPDVVESATMVGGWMDNYALYDGERRFDDTSVAADSLFFKTLGITVLQGNPEKDLAMRDVVYLSDRLARKMFGDENPVGKTISYDRRIPLVVKGVYRAIKPNSSMRPEAVISMPTVLSRDGSEGFGYNYSWHGGDSWHGYVRVKDGELDIDRFNRQIAEVVDRHAPTDENAIKMRITARKLTDTHLMSDDARNMVVIMTVLAVALLAITTLNYVLISISSLSRRSKAVGVHKCIGAGQGSVFAMFMWETLLVLTGAMIVTVLLLFNLRDLIEDTIGASVSDLFAPERLWVVGIVLLTFIAVGGVLPGNMFAGIPVTQVFRRFTEKRSSWKRALLAVEFAGVAFITGLLGEIMVQYHYVINKDKGYDSEMLVIGRNMAQDSVAEDAYASFFVNLPYVEAYSSSDSDPIRGYSGMFVRDGGAEFSTRFDTGLPGYTQFMGMNTVQGREPRKYDEVMINQEFIRRMHWNEETVLTEHPSLDIYGVPVRIVGVLEDFNIYGFFEKPMPFLLVYTTSAKNNVWLKLKAPLDENLRRLRADMKEAFPGVDNEFESYEKIVTDSYDSVRTFRNATLMAAVAVIFITFMGLIGFIGDEIQRRAKEIAIRKVNGAESSDIVRLLAADIMWTAVPSVIVGAGVSCWVGDIWLRQFVVAPRAIWLVAVAAGVAVLLVILACVVIMSRKTAEENPSINLKTE